MLKPIGDNVVVKRDEAASVTPSGIYLPDTGKQRPKTGVVHSANKDSSLKAGDRIIFGSYSGVEVKLNEQEFLILKEEEILAVVE